MSSRRKNLAKSRSRQLDLEQICQFLEYIRAMTVSLLIISVLGFIFSPRIPESNVIYSIIILLNAVILVTSLVIPKFLLKHHISITN